MEQVIKRLCSHLEQGGFRGRVVSIQHLLELQHEIEDRQAQSLFDEAFYRERLTFFEFQPPADFLAAASLIIVAVPRPQTQTTFTWNGTTLALVLPPTYYLYQEISRQVEDLLTRFLAPEGYHIALARLPQKLVAVRSGLAEYGRNNISYVSGMGSFFQPIVFYSDLPCKEDAWREPRMMDRCHDCRACLIKCPTGAITTERFLLHAERCIVFHNERPPHYPFPAWIDPAAHNCVIGCMICQQYCPENKPFLGWFEGNEEFSHEETAMLLEGISRDQLPAATAAKLERLGLIDDLAALPRNLRVFFKEKQAA